MITTVPSGNLTEYVTNKEKKDISYKDQTIIQQTSERPVEATKPQMCVLLCVSKLTT